MRVLSLLVQGFSIKDAARELGIPARTVAFDKYRIMETNRLRTDTDLRELAVRLGLIDPPTKRGSPDHVSRE